MNVKISDESRENLVKIQNTLSGNARDFADAVIAAFESAEADEQEHDITSLKTTIDEIAARFAEQDEEVAEKIQKLKNEIIGMIGTEKQEERMTPAICKEVIDAISHAKNSDEVRNAVNGVMKKNDIADMDFGEVIRAAVVFESKPTELFDAFGRTDLDKVFLVGIDESDADEIAKQWTDNPSAQKDIQDLAAEGVAINTKYIYKLQRMAFEAIDNAREAGTLSQVESEVSRELEQQVKRLAEKAAIVGDNINSAGKKVTTFQAIGKETASSARITTLKPAGASPTIVDLAKTADKVDGAVSEKVLVISKDLFRTLSVFTYASGGTSTILGDAELAAMIGVSRIVKVDYLDEVAGLYAVCLKPNAYKVRIKNELRVAYPMYRNNSLYYQYEMNMGGALTELKSAAVLTDNATSSSH